MNPFVLAWRNILRNGRRSLLTLAAIAVGSVAVLLFGGYVATTVRQLHTESVRAVGQLQIQASGYLDFGRANPGRFAIRDDAALIGRLRADPELAPLLAVVTPVLGVQGVAGNFSAGASSGFFGQGVVPAEQAAMQAWDGLGTRHPPGAAPLSSDDPAGGVIGRGLAQLLALCDALAVRDCRRMPAEPRDDAAPDLPADIADIAALAAGARPAGERGGPVRIELLAASPGGAPNVVAMNVLRAERQGVREIDNALVVMPLPLAQRMVFGNGPPGVSAIVVQLKDSSTLEAARARIERLIAGDGQDLAVLDYHAINPSVDQVIGMFGAIFRFIALLMGIVALFSVANAVNMAVGERVGEIGTLRALGLTRAHIRRMFVAEGCLLGLLGAALGLALSLLFSELLINPAGLSWTPPGRVVRVPIAVDVLGEPCLVAATCAAICLLAALSAWLPARRAARLEVVEALRHA